MKSPPAGEAVTEFRETLLAIQPHADIELIRRAYEVAAQYHQGQKRRSGDPYITHPVAVAKILAGLGLADDQLLCAAILHDTVEYTPYTLAALKREFGAGISTMVAGHMALNHLGWSQQHKVPQMIATIGSTDTRVVTVKMVERLHNMRTLKFLPQVKQLRKAREVLDVYLPVAHDLGMPTVRSELQALAFATLVRNRPAGPPRYRAIVGLDIEQSTSRPDLVKAELRTMLYELFEAALRAADIGPDHRDPFMDRGDGLLALIDPADQALLLSHVVPVFGQLLAGYNAALPPPRRIRVRVAIHAGEVRDDDNGCFGTALDITCRLLDAPEAKAALKASPAPLLLVVSSEIYSSVVSRGCGELKREAFRHLVTTQVAGREHPGWIWAPAPAT
jgi:HD domain-containing protein